MHEAFDLEFLLFSNSMGSANNFITAEGSLLRVKRLGNTSRRADVV